MPGTRKTVAIVTHYYKSRNFGGVMQAYALCRCLHDLGYDAEQLCYARKGTTALPSARPFLDRLRRLTLEQTCRKLAQQMLRTRLQAQDAAVSAFAQTEIPHSEGVYTERTIQGCPEYDAYITGSDQVWNPDWYEPAYFLEFVPSGRPKIAYAASLGHKMLTENQAKLFREKLQDYSAVSVREEDAAGLLVPLSPVPVERTLDPTLLLTREQWEEICGERIVREPYLLCYFLGEYRGSRRLALEYARKKNLKVVFLPHIHGVYRRCDAGFGDKRLYGISPQGFLSLIRHAAYIFTDSFHAVVFSELFGKEYAAFRRDIEDTMTSRVYSVTKLFGSRARFCDSEEKESLAYIERLPSADLDSSLSKLNSMRESSCRFLKENLPPLS